MLYKIVPFLVWLHSRRWPSGVSNMEEVLSAGAAYCQLGLHACALALLAAAVWQPGWAQVAGAVYAVASLALAADLTRAALRLRRATPVS
jgi:hypothetical protein